MANFYQKIIHFIKYHNVVSIVFTIVFLSFSFSLAASPQVREGIFSKKEIEVGIDNTLLLTTNIDNWDFQPKILLIEEDDENYYVTYQFRTLGVKDNVWQEIIKENVLQFQKIVSKNRDLADYVTEEISEVISHEFQLLKDSQKIAQQQGVQKKMKVVEYKGLVGKVLDLKEKILPTPAPLREVEEENLLASLEEPMVEGGEGVSEENQPVQEERKRTENQGFLTEEVRREESPSVSIFPSNLSIVVGSGKIGEQEIEAKIYEPRLTYLSKIFLTWNGNLGERNWYISEIHAIPGDYPENNYFVLRLSSPASRDLEFDYWIVQPSSEGASPYLQDEGIKIAQEDEEIERTDNDSQSSAASPQESEENEENNEAEEGTETDKESEISQVNLQNTTSTSLEENTEGEAGDSSEQEEILEEETSEQEIEEGLEEDFQSLPPDSQEPEEESEAIEEEQETGEASEGQEEDEQAEDSESRDESTGADGEADEQTEEVGGLEFGNVTSGEE